MNFRVKAQWTEKTVYTAEIVLTEEEVKSMSYYEIKEKIESDAGYITNIVVCPDYDSFTMWKEKEKD